MVGKSRFKYKISLTLLGLLATGMLLVDLVVTAYWQKDLVSVQINTEKSNLRIWGELMQRGRSGNSTISLQEIHRMSGKRYVNIARYDNQSLTYASDTEKEKLGELLLSAASGHGDLVRLHGNDWIFDWRNEKYVSIAVYLAPGKAAGGVIRLHSVYPLVGENQWIILVYILVNTIVLTVIGLIRMLDLVFRPIDRLVELTEKYNVSESNYFPIKTENEFGTLTLSLNSMLKRIEEDRQKLCALVSSLERTNKQLRTTQKEMIIAEKMAAVGYLSAGLAHEIGNPLSIVHGYIELLADRELSVEEANQFSERAIFELDRVSTLIRQLLNYARVAPQDIVPASLSKILQETVDAVSIKNQAKNIVFNTDIQLDRDILVGDSSGLRQVILNCLLNAIDAINEKDDAQKGKIEIFCTLVSRELEGERVLITISDDGVGMTETQLLSAFDPFFSTKNQGRGTGLGLFVSYSLIEAAKGRMWLDSSVGNGTVVHIELSTPD